FETVEFFGIAPRLEQLSLTASLLHSASFGELLRRKRLRSFQCVVMFPEEFEDAGSLLPAATDFDLLVILDNLAIPRNHTSLMRMHIPSITVSISTLACIAVQKFDPRRMSSVLSRIFASLTVPQLRRLTLGCGVYPQLVLEWPRAQFLGLCERSDLGRCLKTLRIAEVRIAQSDLLEILSVLEALEHLEVGDAPREVGKRGGKDGKRRGKVTKRDGSESVLITDGFLQKMTCAPSQGCLVPRLSYFTCVSHLVFTHSLLVDFVTSRIARLSEAPAFHVCIHPFPGSDTSITSAVRTRLGKLAAGNQKFVYEVGEEYPAPLSAKHPESNAPLSFALEVLNYRPIVSELIDVPTAPQDIDTFVRWWVLLRQTSMSCELSSPWLSRRRPYFQKLGVKSASSHSARDSEPRSADAMMNSIAACGGAGLSLLARSRLHYARGRDFEDGGDYCYCAFSVYLSSDAMLTLTPTSPPETSILSTVTSGEEPDTGAALSLRLLSPRRRSLLPSPVADEEQSYTCTSALLRAESRVPGRNRSTGSTRHLPSRAQVRRGRGTPRSCREREPEFTTVKAAESEGQPFLPGLLLPLRSRSLALTLPDSHPNKALPHIYATKTGGDAATWGSGFVLGPWVPLPCDMQERLLSEYITRSPHDTREAFRAGTLLMETEMWPPRSMEPRGMGPGTHEHDARTRACAPVPREMEHRAACKGRGGRLDRARAAPMARARRLPRQTRASFALVSSCARALARCAWGRVMEARGWSIADADELEMERRSGWDQDCASPSRPASVTLHSMRQPCLSPHTLPYLPHYIRN
ncbi:hypothetical protein B0H12DRAFT_1312857, partial [Mycena haematopus]